MVPPPPPLPPRRPKSFVVSPAGINVATASAVTAESAEIASGLVSPESTADVVPKDAEGHSVVETEGVQVDEVLPTSNDAASPIPDADEELAERKRLVKEEEDRLLAKFHRVSG